MPLCCQVNLQRQFGGGEVYTRAVCAALADLGWRSTLIVDAAASFWHGMDLPSTELIPVADLDELVTRVPTTADVVLTHGGIMSPYKGRLAAAHRLWGIAHMPLAGRRRSDTFRGYHQVFGVSEYVRQTLLDAGTDNVFATPLYASIDLAPRPFGDPEIRRHPPYEWDRRKLRDRLLGWSEPLWRPAFASPRFSRQPGITIGIVSRLATIKQFPQLFSLLTPVLARHPEFMLDIFGSGGYASVRDLKRALAPLRRRVRFWGPQADVAAVYRQIDYVMTGLPELEALGLNVIEAQACGTPVLAVMAPPFTETVLEGECGFFYRDPRHDCGADFDRLLSRLERERPRIATSPAIEQHLARFSPAAFRERLRTAFTAAEVVT